MKPSLRPAKLAAALVLLAAACLAQGDGPVTESTTSAPSPSTEASTEVPTDAPTTPSTQGPEKPSDSPTPAPNSSVSPNPTEAPVGPVINIKFVNDLRYHLYPMPSSGTGNCASSGPGSCLGGVGCLAAVDRSATDTLWLHSGVAMGYGEDKGLDMYQLLRASAANEALKLLDFKAMSVDADMFRSGLDTAKETVAAVGAAKVACANCDAALGDVKKYLAADVSSCSVAVIGVISKSRADKMSLSGIKDEVESIKEAVAAAKTELTGKKVLYVVIGEATEKTATDILDQVADVGVILYSGNDIDDAAGYKLAKTTKGQAYATLAPALTKEAMRVATLKLTLDAECKLIDSAVAVEAYGSKTQDDCLKNVKDETTKNSLTALTTKMLKAVEDASQAVGTSVLALSSEPCQYISCALGQLVADGVRAVANKGVATGKWAEASRAVVIPASRFVGSLAAAPITRADVSALFKDEGSVCAVSVTGLELYAALESLLSSDATFPQVSGMWVDYQPDATQRVVVVWLQTAELTMWPVARDGANHSVLMPCSAVSQLGLTAAASTKTGVTLSDGLLWHLPVSDAKTVLVPPTVEPRVRLHVGIPRSADLCEDWTGMSVAYTLLVLGAMAMVGYQGYQFWRFRSTLSYIR